MRNHYTTTLIAYRVASDVAGKAAFFAVTVLAARRLSQEEFGILSLGSTLGWLVAVASDLGMQAHLARAVAQRPGEAQRLLEAWLKARWYAASIGLVLVLSAIGVTGTGAPFVGALLLFIALYAVSGLVEFLHHFYRGLSRSDVESTLVLCWRFVMLACAAAALHLHPDVTTLAVALLVPALVTLAASVRRARQLASASSDRADAGTAIDVRAELRRDVLPIGAGVLLSALYFRIDVVLIEIWNGTAAVGLYTAVFRLVDALRLFPAAVLAVTLPWLGRSTTARVLGRVAGGLTAFAVGVAAVLWWTAGALVPMIYGAAFADAVPAFRVLLLSFPLMSLNYALTQQLIAWHGHRAYAGICASALVWNLVLNARLIPTLSILGAAWATMWTEVVVTCGCAAALWMSRSRDRSSEVTVGASS